MYAWNEVIVSDSASIPSTKYWLVVLNPDWSWIGWWVPATTPYSMVAYFANDATYDIEYYCEAISGTTLTTPSWRVFRIRNTKATGNFYDKTWATGATFSYAATNLATVAAYTYS